MRYILRKIDFRYKSKKGLVEEFEERTLMEEGMHRVENILLDNAPVFLIKEGWYPIWARSLMWTQLINYPLNLFICHWVVKVVFLMLINFWDSQDC